MSLLTLNRKSQIAIEYAYRLHKKSPATSVFWVHANNTARFKQSYRNIASAAKIPGIEDPKADVLNLVFQWLGSDESGSWLLILDNADDTDLFFSPFISATAQTSAPNTESPCLSGYLPQTGTGSILVTSRDEGTAIRLTGSRKQVLRVEIMSKDDTNALLHKKLPDDSSDTTAKEQLIIELGSIPLAITQASAYIAIQGSRITIAKYLQLLRSNNDKQVHLLSRNEADLRRDPEVPNSVITTWQISFLKIKERNAAAAELLSRMCFLDRHGIPEFLFCEEDDEPSLGFEEAVGILIQFSFVTEVSGKKTFTIHRLVQLATRIWSETYGEAERIREEVLDLVWRHYPYGKYENWSRCEVLEPHAQIVLGSTYNSHKSELQKAHVLNQNARYNETQGRFKISEEKVQKAINLRRSYLDPDHLDHLESFSLLATIYTHQRRWDEAEQLQVQIIETRKRVLKADHPSTLVSIGNLAEIYRGQRRWDEAEKLVVQVMEKMKRVLGPDHPDTLISMTNLAETYRNQGRWDEAEKLLVQVIETRKRVLGPDHPGTLISMTNLAETYRNQGRWDEAEKLLVQVMETMKRVLKPDHPDTLTSMADLAVIYTDQGRWDKAEKLLVQVIETRKRVLESDHPDTLTTMTNLAVIYMNQERWDKAEKLLVQVIETRKIVLGPDHPGTLTTMSHLAVTYWRQGRCAEAIALMRSIVDVQKKVIGEDHPETVISIELLKIYVWFEGR
jgi:tetratricopeptide (TPR) repeat protein